MTEITDNAVQLPIAVQRFVLHWGEMGGQWGVNRSVAQIHALLYLSDRPLNAEEISDTLRIARSNTSNSLKELLGWKLIRRVPVMGDRRDHYEAEVDLMQMLTRIAQGRKEREIDPAVAALKVCTEEAKRDARISETARARITAMQDFVVTIDDWYQQMMSVPPGRLMMLIRLGKRILTFLPKSKAE
ncbi:MarR family transcriptional regulator [Sphingomonas sp. HITSZ_GF]|uniref:GbsR/MarR family transcriptional regulator n=1 Tax=Sphingomonas sp. HITSZ_GF TaxID=3037247 RepID=UPI00240E858F|nr:MarR family transcriptional regulator [Sphingomonas sp. HITSZ_GF]MDG2534276.1 MarR family transcriptional regulator [Sphingomonas sp. HITSZ_GF]